MIISLEEAKKILKDLTDEEIERELAAVETMIRNKTNNKFHNKDIKVCQVIEFKDNKIYGPFKDKFFRVGDRIEIVGAIINDGLYDVVEVTDDYIVLDKEVEDLKAHTLVVKIDYPEDILKGVRELLQYDLKMKDKIGIKSETISRYSVQYFDLGSNENVEGYPHSLMAFIKKYKKLRWS